MPSCRLFVCDSFQLCANTWGTQWGENGLFRLKRKLKGCKLEMFVVAAWNNLYYHQGSIISNQNIVQNVFPFVTDQNNSTYQKSVLSKQNIIKEIPINADQNTEVRNELPVVADWNNSMDQGSVISNQTVVKNEFPVVAD